MAEWIPALAVAASALVVAVIVRHGLRIRARSDSSYAGGFMVQAWTAAIVLIGMLVSILVMPEYVDGNLAFSAIGLVATAVLAISGQSIIANAMAGIMLRIIKNFRPGDFIEVGGHTGRVSEMGLVHTEIQSSDRDLITLPNLWMANQPVRVVRSSGTVVSVQVGLAYDISRHRVRELLVAAGEAAELEEPFVQVMELGDYSVTYRVAGFLAESNRILTARSRLREAILDTFGDAGVEIVSPTYVARRAVGVQPLVPDPVETDPILENGPTAEDKVFDKADLAADAENLREQHAETEESLAKLYELVANQVDDDAERTQRLIEIEAAELDRLAQQLRQIEGVHQTQD